MHLLLFRHGIAENVGPDGQDGSRRLTREGIDKTREAVHGLLKILDAPKVVLTSPLIRAKQTADILCDAFDLTPIMLPSLATGPATHVMHDLKKQDEERVVLVGHEPTLSQLGGLLCTGHDPSYFIQLKKAGAMMIETAVNRNGPAGDGTLLWLATPTMLRALA